MRDSGDAGTTLLEALVVMAVVALIGGLAFPAVDRQLGAWRFASDARRLAADLDHARALARRGDNPARVVATGTGYAVTRIARVDLERALPQSRVSLASPLTFFADGSARGGPVRLSQGRYRLNLAVDPATGRVVRTGW